ncbi:uncharacterized protein LOC114531676 [Dendronephthya gigantea]|uniref:uncharacterized protein LOC114531676 n=1 Tax=Dendronephthya gigantea TaxID=151771 RepID=UPI00106D1AE2|nr:uncharacterized protein LOC114531676 [Dendronephthya gigantea]
MAAGQISSQERGYCVADLLWLRSTQKHPIPCFENDFWRFSYRNFAAMSTRKKARRPSLKGSLNPSKRHRDRVNVELDNLAKLLPFPPEVIAKLDKLSVLRLSASYLRTKNFFKGLNVGSKLNTDSSKSDEFEKTGAVSDLLLEALDGFLMVLTQDGEVFYASETISNFLGVSQASVIHQDFLRFVHADDQQMIENNLKLVPTPTEPKIRDITDDSDESAAETSDNAGGENGKDLNKERSFVCRFKCILNTNAGFFKPFRCHGRLRQVDVPDSTCPQMALFLICSPLEMTTSIIEVRMKSMLFCTKNKLDLTFVDIDQKGRQIVGYTKKDIQTQSSYCMMHYDDIPVLRKMHQDLMSTGKCEGVFRWLNKQMKWQWLSGSGQVIFKNNRPDFVITTNKPLTDEEGDEEVRRRERDLGIVPTSPVSLLSHLQINSPPPSNVPVGSHNGPQPHTTGLSPDSNVSPSLVGPGLPTTSCTSDPFPPEDLPWDLNTEALFEANEATWDPRASLSDLDGIGKGDLVSDLFEIDVNSLNLDPLDESNTVPLTHASDSSYPLPEISPNPSVPPPDAWALRDQRTTSQYPPVRVQPQPVQSSGMLISTYSNNGVIPHTGGMPPPGIGTTGMVSPHTGGMPPSGISTTGMVSPPSVPPGVMPGRHVPRNGINSSVPNGPVVNGPNPSMGYHQPTMTSSQPLPRGNVASNPTGLLTVQTQPMLNRSYIKTEPVRSTGYYCNSASGDRSFPGGVSNGLPFQGVPTQNNAYRYQNNKLNHGGIPQWTTAPPSPYSSGSSSTSSYDALHVQFSPTEILTSPFASPGNDNEYNHLNASHQAPYPGPPQPGGGHTKRSFQRPPPSFPQPFVDIPEIAPVEELIPGMHHTSPIASRATAGLTHL